MNTKRIPAIIMLMAGAVACIVTYLEHYEFIDMLKILAIVLVVFLIIGLIVKLILDSFEMPEPEIPDDDGEVVEKQGEDGILEQDGEVEATGEQGE